jgi:hypothetical protein
LAKIHPEANKNIVAKSSTKSQTRLQKYWREELSKTQRRIVKGICCPCLFSIFFPDLLGAIIYFILDAEYTRLCVEQDIKEYFSSSEGLSVDCPCCGGARTRKTFSRLGMEYKSCADCFTSYVGLRPKQKVLNNFYKESASRKYWLDEIWNSSKDVRFKKVLTPLVDWMKNFHPCEKELRNLKILEFMPNNPGLNEVWSRDDGELYYLEPTIPNSSLLHLE